jgi:alginate O-acetyltransferase complex protein AlgI
MLFNSFTFLVGFLPAALLLVLIVQRFGSATANLLTVLVLSSVFYCYSSVGFYALLLGSVVANYLISGVVERRTFLVLGIGLNLLLLGVFKYSGFLTGELNRAGLPVAVVSFGRASECLHLFRVLRRRRASPRCRGAQ